MKDDADKVLSHKVYSTLTLKDIRNNNSTLDKKSAQYDSTTRSVTYKGTNDFSSSFSSYEGCQDSAHYGKKNSGIPISYAYSNYDYDASTERHDLIRTSKRALDTSKRALDLDEKKIDELVANKVSLALDKYSADFQPQVNRRLTDLFEHQSKDLEKKLDDLISQEILNLEGRFQNKMDSFDEKMEESKSSVLGSIAIFSGIISYISVSVNLFDKVSGAFEMVSILMSIMLSLVCFLVFIIASLKKQFTPSTYVAISVMAILAVCIAFGNEYGVYLMGK
jgi:hypothetical protein